MIRRIAPLAVTVAALALPACGGDDDADLTIYSGRNEELAGELIERFEREGDLQVDVRYGDSAELAATIAEEGDNSPADVFFSQDAGALGAVEDTLSSMPRSVLDAVPDRFRDPRGRWVGASGRARVIAYNTDKFEESEVPDSVFDLTDKRWRGRVGIPPPNASFQAFVSAMRLEVGEKRTREWLEGMRDNDAQLYDNNIQTVEAIGRGEIDLGLVNHYYLYELKREDPGLAVANHFLRRGDPGSLVNAAGVGILKTTDDQDNAERFARFLVSKGAQRYFAEKTFEYPLIEGVQPPGGLPRLEELIGPQAELGRLGNQLRSTLRLLDEVGFTT
ncbi:MAG TPA: iron ABC transporter substrate-binding protein [Thermoleophilaceae bacterium]|nr:iron ABC transporter substrate-binding protein [Thermoleophilaceae bacterium]